MFLDKIEGSPSLEMVNLVLKKQAAGEKVVSLAIGEPSFNTPPEIVDVACASMRAGDVHYTSSFGIPEVREAISRKVSAKNGMRAGAQNAIFLTTKLAVYASMMALVKGPCEVLLPDPGYFYNEPVVLAGGTPRHYRLGEGFSLDPDLVRKAATKKTRVLVVNTPANPTGRVFTRGELKELYDLCAERKISIVSDEAYEDLVYGKRHFSVGSLEKEPDLVVTLFSLSKSYAMTGWRAGYAVASERTVSLISRFLENTYTSYPPFIQRASAYALENGDRFITDFARELRSRKEQAEEWLAKIPGMEPYEAEGAFYLFPSYGRKASSVDVAKRILLQEAVAVLPGIAFGQHGEGRLRISFSGPPSTIEEGMAKLAHFFSHAD
ncbi:MAG: aminotransferase class I/II-fold pyridoxal phosphate-dependent enzyme [Thaumarchaeota archaeon]|nr:aminotransferase class I/II-fold pyridoxal phosphate-dependent enzyme [Nitrososphaerota archaeon]